MEIPPVLCDQCSTGNERSGGDEGVGCLRCVVVEHETIEQVVGQIENVVRLDDDRVPLDECKPLRAQVSIPSHRKFSADGLADGKVGTADVRRQRLTKVVRSHDCRRVEEDREISQRVAAVGAA